MKKMSMILSVLLILGLALPLHADEGTEAGAVGATDGKLLRAGPRLVARGVAVAEGDYKIMAVHLLRIQGDEAPVEPVLEEGEEDPSVAKSGGPGDRPDGIFRFGGRIFALRNLSIEVGEGEQAASTGGGPGLVRAFKAELHPLKGQGPRPIPMTGSGQGGSDGGQGDADAVEPDETEEVAPVVEGPVAPEAIGSISGTVHPAEATANRTVPVLDGEATVDGATYRLLGRVTPVRPVLRKIKKKISDRVRERIKEIREKRENSARPEGEADPDEELQEQSDVVEDAF